MMTFKMKLVGALSAMAVGSVMGQKSCVQVNSTDFSSCPCEDAVLKFTLEGDTTVAANTVNLAVILDGSSSIYSSSFAKEQEFAKNTVAAFARRNLFDNGGMASYVQYSDALASSGTFASAQDFDAFAAADLQAGGSTATFLGIEEGTALLGVNPATASFMVVITDGNSNSKSTTEAAADAARDEGIIVFAVGVGNGIRKSELEAIGGGPANVFQVAQFDLLDAALASILTTSGGKSAVPCPSTGAMVTVEFSVPIGCAGGGSISGSTATFIASDLEANATEFNIVLELCNEGAGGSVVVSADYTDDQGNSPDLSVLTGLVVGDDSCAPSSTSVVTCPNKSSKSTPTLGQFLQCGSADASTYLGCYVDEAQDRSLKGPMSSASNMTAKVCENACISSGYEYFGTAYASDCHCGTAQPAGTEDLCEYECAGDTSTACGGVGSMCVYQSN